MGSTLVDAAVVLILGLAVIVALRHLGERGIAALERRQTPSEGEERLALRERTAATELSEATAEQRAELERAELNRRAADERAKADVAADPRVISAQIDEELRVIAARTEARVAVVRERGGADDAAIIEALKAGYYRHLDTDSECTFTSWLEGANVRGLSLDAIEKLIESYVTYLDRDCDDTFGDWFSEVDPRMFQ